MANENQRAGMTVAEQDKAAAASGDMQPCVAEAMRRYKFTASYESVARNLFACDWRFAHGDSDNNYQWPDEVRGQRGGGAGEAARPCLTINKVQQHNRMIVNDAKKNKPGIKYAPVGNAATAQSAEMLNGLARHVEQQSNAMAVYDSQTDFMVQGGFGFWRVQTDYADTESFDQEIYIRGVKNPLNAFKDPNTVDPDGLDAKWGLIIDDVPREYFEVKYPKFANYANQSPFEGFDTTWYTDSVIRVAEYYRLRGEADVLWAYVPTGANAPVFIKESLLKGNPELLRKVRTAEGSRSRPIVTERLEWYFIVGTKIADKRLDMPGKYIPLVKIAAEETVIDGKYDCKSHTRALKDPQRMYNYWSSAAVEFGALQTKTPWIAGKSAIEGNERDWNSANTTNKSVLLYNDLADDGVTKLDMPQRVQPPVSAPVALDGMKISSEEMMTVSGQYQAMMGAPSNERSGDAIEARQKQGDTATFHFIDAVSKGIRSTAKILLDLFPYIYDTERVIEIIQENGKTLSLLIDPKAQKAYEERQAQDQQTTQRVLNPRLGQYEVIAKSGPGFDTRREQAFQSFVQMLGQAPTLIPILGDILFRNADFPNAEEAADRLQRMVPSYVLGEGPTPQEQALLQQVSNLRTMVGKLMEDSAIDKGKLKGKDQQKVIDVYNAITNRLKLFTPKPGEAQGAMSEQTIRSLVMEAVHEAFDLDVDLVGDASEPNLATEAQVANPLDALADKPPFPGAKKGADGRWYGRNFQSSAAYTPFIGADGQ